MRVIKEFKNDEYVFDIVKRKKSKETIELDDDKLKIDYDLLINTQFSGGNITNQKDFDKLKALLNLGRYSKAPCGGFINFYSFRGKTGRKYVLFSGVKETSNSYYIVTLHKVIIME